MLTIKTRKGYKTQHRKDKCQTDAAQSKYLQAHSASQANAGYAHRQRPIRKPKKTSSERRSISYRLLFSATTLLLHESKPA